MSSDLSLSAREHPNGSRLKQRKTWIEAVLIVAFWGGIGLLLLGQEMLEPHYGREGLREGEALYSVLQISVWAVITPLVFWLIPFLSPARIGWWRTLPIAILLGVAIAVVVDFIDHFLWNTLVTGGRHRPLSFLYILDNFHFLKDFFIYLAVLAAGMARSFFQRVEEHRQETLQLRMDTARLQTHLAEARLNALRMQINPHFLFNTLHIISDHFEEDPRAARRMIARLSDILRYTFEGTDTREVPLAEEMRFLDGYLDIQRYRFEDRLNVEMDIHPDTLDAMVPSLILQPLVENAIKHGISQIEGQGIISIRTWFEENALHVQIKDNGPGKMVTNGSKIHSGGIGLRNTRERLNMLYGEGEHLVIASSPTDGFSATVIVPYRPHGTYSLSPVEA